MATKIVLSNRTVGIILLSTFAFIFFLCFIDEGYYDFRWMKNLGNWVVFFLYWMILFWLGIGVAYLSKFILKR